MGSKRKKPGILRWVFFLVLAIIALWLLIGMNGIEQIAVSFLPSFMANRETRLELRKEKNQLVDELCEKENEITRIEAEKNVLSETVASISDGQSISEYWSDYPEITGVFARIVLRDPYNLYTSFIIDKGSNDGIAPGMPVLGRKEVIGRVIDVRPEFSRVRFITSPGLSFGAHVKRTNDLGVLVGGKKELILAYLTFNADVALGDEIVTSGTTDITPGGLPLGKVTEVIQKNPEEELIIKVKQDEDIGKLLNVYVVTSTRKLPPGITLEDVQH